MYKKLTEEEKKALEKYPKYDDNKPETWVGSKEYFESIFTMEQNRDPELHEAFSQLHKAIVNMVIQFCENMDLRMLMHSMWGQMVCQIIMAIILGNVVLILQ